MYVAFVLCFKQQQEKKVIEVAYSLKFCYHVL
jgi:hypothetical protein